MQSNDERTRFAQQFNLKETVFSESVVTVELPREAARSRGNVAAFLLAANLLSRTFDEIHAVFPEGTVVHRHPWHLSTVGQVIDELSETVDGVLHVGSPEHSDVVLAVGGSPTVPASRQVVVRGSQWRASLDCELQEGGEGILGSLYAATIGAAQALLHALEMDEAPYKPMQPFSFSLLECLPSRPTEQALPPLSLPEAHLVGVGAVGSAAVYALAHLDNVSGTLHLIDNEKVDNSNRQRYALLRRRDVDEPKVSVASEALADTTIQVEPYLGAFARYIDEHPDVRVGLLLSPVDSEEGRRALARMLPRRVINAATGGTTVTVSTHGFADGKACLHCLYLPDPRERSREEIMAEEMGLDLATVQRLVETNEPVGPELVAQVERHQGLALGSLQGYIGLPVNSLHAKAVCGDAGVNLSASNVIAPLPFISAAAGILLAAELVKSGHPELGPYALDNYFRLDTFRRPNPAFRRTCSQEPSGRCICWDPDYVAIYSEKHFSK